jgi:hypothetical protein
VASLVLAGDWHADADHAIRVIDRAADRGVQRIVQVGDFGYWPRHPTGQRFLTRIAARCVERGVTVWFCDGNHEDHGRLMHRRAVSAMEVAPHISWVPRGAVMEWDGRRFLFMGGAVSVDRLRRTPGFDWFPEEIPTEAQFDRAGSAGQVDVVVAHEGLPGTPLRSGYTAFIPPEIVELADDVRTRMGRLADTVKPELWVHGHWHHRMTAQRGATRVELLHESRGPFEETAVLCDLETMGIGPL